MYCIYASIWDKSLAARQAKKAGFFGQTKAWYAAPVKATRSAGNSKSELTLTGFNLSRNYKRLFKL